MSGQDSDWSDTINLKHCVVLGTAGYAFVAGDTVDLQFGCDALVVQAAYGRREDIPYLEVVDIAISGPGSVTTGGGFIGGGFGVVGALQGMAIAAVLNNLTSSTEIHTFMALLTHLGELHLHYGDMEPGALRIALSKGFTTLRRLDPMWLRARLERLEALRTQQVLADSDFERLKQRLLGPSRYEDLSARWGKCPSCEAIIPLISEECPKCKARFTDGGVWKVKPISF